ncbi:efflux protein, MATE family, partial [gut metagenome]
ISLLGVGIVSTLGIVLGGCAVVFARPLLGIYNSDPEVIAIGVRRMYFICIPYFTGGIMDVMAGSMRGLGYSVLPTLISLLGVCGLRMLWIFTVFAREPSLDVLFFVYPLSWVVTSLAHILCFVKARRNIPAEDIPDSPFY